MPRAVLFIVLLFVTPVLADDALTFHGRFEQGGIIIGRTEPGTRLTLDGRTVIVSPDGDFVFGFDRDHEPEANSF